MFHAEDGTRDLVLARGLVDVYRRTPKGARPVSTGMGLAPCQLPGTARLKGETRSARTRVNRLRGERSQPRQVEMATEKITMTKEELEALIQKAVTTALDLSRTHI